MIETTRSVRKEERRRTVVAIVVSVTIHALLLLIALVFLWLNAASIFAPEPEPDEPVTLTIVPQEPEPTPEEKGFVDSAQGEVTEDVPEDARFESDANTTALSQATPTDDSEAPAVDGQEDAGAIRDLEMSLGPIEPPSQASPASQPTEAAPEEPIEPTEERPPVDEPADAEEPEPTPEEEKPEGTPEPSPTPTAPADLAFLDPTLRKPAPKPEVEVPKPELPKPPSPARPPGYQPETRTTRLTGGISNRGSQASIEAMATPLGRYKKQMQDAIGSRWYYYVNDMIDLVNVGTVKISFTIRSDGKVEGVRVLSNTSNESLASVSVRSVMAAEIPPIPEAIVGELQGGRIEVDYTFSILGGRVR